MMDVVDRLSEALLTVFSASEDMGVTDWGDDFITVDMGLEEAQKLTRIILYWAKHSQ